MSPSFKQTATFDVVRGNVYCVKTVFLFCVFFSSFCHSCRVGPRFISVGKLRLSWKSWSSTSHRVERSSAQNHLVRWPQKKKSPSLYQRVNVLLFPVNCDLADPFSPLCYCWHRVAGREREELSRTFPEFREAEGYAYKSQKMARGPHSSTRATHLQLVQIKPNTQKSSHLGIMSTWVSLSQRRADNGRPGVRHSLIALIRARRTQHEGASVSVCVCVL